MNVYSKLQEARVQLQNKNLKKSGNNTFAGYTYFELKDFLPEINEIFNELKLCSFVTFSTELATLTIINSEKPEEQIIFTSPMAESPNKKMTPIQELGSQETYSRRYLYMTALEIVEDDTVDATSGNEQKPQNFVKNESKTVQNDQKQVKKASDAQVKLIHNLLVKWSEKTKLTKEQLLEKMNVKAVETLSSTNASKVIEHINKQMEVK